MVDMSLRPRVPFVGAARFVGWTLSGEVQDVKASRSDDCLLVCFVPFSLVVPEATSTVSSSSYVLSYVLSSPFPTSPAGFLNADRTVRPSCVNVDAS